MVANASPNPEQLPLSDVERLEGRAWGWRALLARHQKWIRDPIACVRERFPALRPSAYRLLGLLWCGHIAGAPALQISLLELAELLGMGRRTVFRGVADLVRAELLLRIHTSRVRVMPGGGWVRGRGRNLYRLTRRALLLLGEGSPGRGDRPLDYTPVREKGRPTVDTHPGRNRRAIEAAQTVPRRGSAGSAIVALDPGEEDLRTPEVPTISPEPWRDLERSRVEAVDSDSGAKVSAAGPRTSDPQPAGCSPGSAEPIPAPERSVADSRAGQRAGEERRDGRRPGQEALSSLERPADPSRPGAWDGRSRDPGESSLGAPGAIGDSGSPETVGDDTRRSETGADPASLEELLALAARLARGGWRSD